MKAQELVFEGIGDLIEKWCSDATYESYSRAREGHTALECHEEVAQDAGAWRHKVADVYGMGLISLGEYDKLQDYIGECLSAVTDYIWNELGDEEEVSE